jgi:hypothetical protein
MLIVKTKEKEAFEKNLPDQQKLSFYFPYLHFCFIDCFFYMRIYTTKNDWQHLKQKSIDSFSNRRPIEK